MWGYAVKLHDITRAVRSLPTSEQSELRKKLGWMSTVGDVIVEIHDWKGADRKWPRAVVIRSDRSSNEIDILASVNCFVYRLTVSKKKIAPLRLPHLSSSEVLNRQSLRPA